MSSGKRIPDYWSFLTLSLTLFFFYRLKTPRSIGDVYFSSLRIFREISSKKFDVKMLILST